MSLNRCEQRVYDYLQGHSDERQYWQAKVSAMSRATPDDYEAAAKLDRELWDYYEERSRVVEPFRSAVQHEGRQRTSMKSLAELMLRLWTAPRAKKKRLEDPGF